jgi:hypothetical protein
MAAERERIHAQLQELFDSEAQHETVLDLESARVIVFSDQHKGQRDGADDFRRCERAYNAALGYYFAKGYTLMALGDVEELWECRPKDVIANYGYTLALEANFHRDGRYLRFFGNHDDQWESPRSVMKFLDEFYPGLEVKEGARFRVRKGDADIGTIFLAHGHQGTTMSDKYKWISRFVVRNVWRPVQRLLKKPSTTPATDFILREKHDLAMYGWAEEQEKTVLIVGHTHRPVFSGITHHAQLERQLSTATGERAAELRAELEWVKAQDGGIPGTSEALGAAVKPCYFNSGCCSFGDGDITGLEIVDGKIQLVRWPDDDGKPKPKVIASADLASEVFAKL